MYIHIYICTRLSSPLPNDLKFFQSHTGEQEGIGSRVRVQPNRFTPLLFKKRGREEIAEKQRKDNQGRLTQGRRPSSGATKVKMNHDVLGKHCGTEAAGDSDADRLGFQFERDVDGKYRVTAIEWWAASLLTTARPSPYCALFTPLQTHSILNAALSCPQDRLLSNGATANERVNARVGDCVISINGVVCEDKEPAELEAMVHSIVAGSIEERQKTARVAFDFGDGRERFITIKARRAPVSKRTLPPVPAAPDPAKARARVVVIGAGVAGLTAARELAQKGLHVTILEARARTGGRVHTGVLAGDESAAPAYIDLGASFIHGCAEAVNPVYKLAVKHKAAVDDTNGGYSIAWAQAAAWCVCVCVQVCVMVYECMYVGEYIHRCT